ncbi:hypothetical protein [Streptomyces sp. NPDC051776]
MSEVFPMPLILLHGGYDVSFAGATTPTAVRTPSTEHGVIIEP